MSQQVQWILHTGGLYKVWREYIRSTPPLLEEKLRTIDPYDTDSVQQTIETFLSESRDEADNSLVHAQVLGASFDKVRLYREVCQRSIKDHLKSVEICYDKANTLTEAYSTLHRFVSGRGLTVTEGELCYSRIKAIDLAGQLLHGKRYDLRQIPTEITGEFYEHAKQKAISLGAPSPELLAISEELNTTKAALTALEARNLQLMSETEVKAAHLATQQLIPLTDGYLATLLLDAKRYYPNLDLKDYNQTLPNTPSLAGSKAQQSYNKIKNKVTAVQALRRYLHDTTSLPSERVQRFKDALHQYDHTFKQQQDSPWTTYVHKCLALIVNLAVIATGVGLIGFIAYSTATGKSPFFFSGSKDKGTRFATHCETTLMSSI